MLQDDYRDQQARECPDGPGGGHRAGRGPVQPGAGVDREAITIARVAHDKALPFGPLRPNAETIAAMEEARAGNLAGFDSMEALMADLNEDD